MFVTTKKYTTTNILIVISTFFSITKYTTESTNIHRKIKNKSYVYLHCKRMLKMKIDSANFVRSTFFFIKNGRKVSIKSANKERNVQKTWF